MKSTMTKNQLIESVEELEAAQQDLDLVVDRIRRAVEGGPEESTATAYTIPCLSMMAHEEGHGYMGKQSGNLDSIIRDLEEIIDEKNMEDIEREDSERIEREDIGDAELDLEGDDDPEVRRGREKGLEEKVVKGYVPNEVMIHQPLVTTGAGVEVKNPCYVDCLRNRKVGEKLVVWDAAPGMGKHVYLLTRMDMSGVWGIKEGEAGEDRPDPTDVDESRQVKIHNQPDRVRDVLTALTDEELGMLRVACRSFDGHPGVDSKTIIFYKPEFLATALLGSVEDHARLQPRMLSEDDQVRGSKGMTAKGLSVAFEILSKFERAGFPGVEMEDLAHVEMEMHDEMGRETYLADLKVIEGGAK